MDELAVQRAWTGSRGSCVTRDPPLRRPVSMRSRSTGRLGSPWAPMQSSTCPSTQSDPASAATRRLLGSDAPAARGGSSAFSTILRFAWRNPTADVRYWSGQAKDGVASPTPTPSPGSHELLQPALTGKRQYSITTADCYFIFPLQCSGRGIAGRPPIPPSPFGGSLPHRRNFHVLPTHAPLTRPFTARQTFPCASAAFIRPNLTFREVHIPGAFVKSRIRGCFRHFFT